MRQGSGRRWGFVSLFVVTACSFEPVDLEDRMCPCADGWVCVAEQCEIAGQDAGIDIGADVQRDVGDDASADAGTDAGVDGGVDGGPVDVGTDAPDVGPRSVCDDSTAFFCADFEDGSLVPPWTRSIHDAAGIVENSDVRAANGARSLRAAAAEPRSRARMHYEFPELHDETYARANVYVPSTSPHEFISVLLLGSDDALVALQVLADDTFSMFVTGGNATVEPVTIARDRWICLTLSLVVTSGTAVYRATMDGTTIYDGPVMGSLATATDFAMAGIENTGAANAEIFVDDVELSTTPLPCGAE